MAFISARLIENPQICIKTCFRVLSASKGSEGLSNHGYPKKPSRGYSTQFNLGSGTTSATRLIPCKAFSQNIQQYYTTKSVFVSSLIVTRARMLSTTSSTANVNSPKVKDSNEEVPLSKPQEGDSSSPTSPTPPLETELSTKEKLKRAVKDYGATVIVFHITMSLMSLGFFYVLVSSGLDVVALLGKVGISESLLQSKVTEEASKFVVAYAIHKVFAPLRITITLTATPLIVRKLRSMGVLKQAVKAKSS